MSNQPMLLFLELNEVNFEFVEHYAAEGQLPNFKAVLEHKGFAKTTSEYNYDDLEPWIQWVTAHTGLTLEQHGVFRLGDIVNTELDQIWERLAARGLNVGAVSPMNAKCRSPNMAFFVPDPWTKTELIAEPMAKRLYFAIAQAVSDNAQSRVTLASLVDLIAGIIAFALPKNYARYIRYLTSSFSRPWMKAIFLDQLLSDLFINSVIKYKTDFSTLFLNAGAHIQHHYMFSSKFYNGDLRNPTWYVSPQHDPILDVYKAYDLILGDTMSAFPSGRIMLATGLHQDPHNAVTYYWRIKDHANFLRDMGIAFQSVEPRMSRDFLVKCRSAEQAKDAELGLASAFAQDGIRLFEVDNRGSDLFVMFVYPKAIEKLDSFQLNGKVYANLRSYVAFVAIKNGRHNGIGYFADTGASARLDEMSFALAELPMKILDAFSIKMTEPALLMAR